jgi:crotonobetainyl-CoA:carnitine CoA-transferase CaiB-like acyl-CoA transferase
MAVNAGKKSVTVDLKTKAGASIVRSLAQHCDVVVENFRPGAAERMGLGYVELRQVNPRLVYCSISGFGQTGAMRDWPAYEHTIKAISGMMWSGADDDLPTQSRGFSVDCFSGYVAFAAILAALLRRERCGVGQYLDVAMLDASVVLMAVGLFRQMVTQDNQSALQPIVHDRPTVGAYRARDGWLWLSANLQHQWQVLCRVLDAEDLLADPRFASGELRARNSAVLKDELSRRIAPQFASELELRLMAAGCPAARVRTSREFIELERSSGRESFLAARAGDREIRVAGAGYRASDVTATLAGGVPPLGAHTDEVLESIGLTAAERAGLRAAGAI